MSAKADSIRRWLLLLAYLLFSAVGAEAIFIIPTTFAQQGLARGLVLGWVGTLFGGGLCAFVGMLAKRPLPELIGIVALGTGFTAYAVALTLRAASGTSTLFAAGLVGAVICLLIARYFEILRMAQVGARQ